jgi:dihydrofolate synthase/folylpolyglutamate synthase
LDFKQVTKYLDDALIFGIKPSLIRINKILGLMGGPQQKLDYIHIVGTNGKTSTTIILASILKEMGYKTAYHISPHIDSYAERIWLNGNPITEDAFAIAFKKMYPYIEKVNELDLGGPITQFEIITALTYMIARDEGIKVMVQEAGMGGRWDATNAADSCVVGLTGVSLEHTEILGDTIEEITLEKVEVIKKAARAATISVDGRVQEIFIQKSKEVEAEYYIFGKDFGISRKKQLGISGWEVDINGIYGKYKSIKLPLLGDYQPVNLALAVALTELYMDIKGSRPDPQILKDSLSGIYVRGRFEIIGRDPMVIADASHNPEGTEKFCQTVEKYFPENKKTIIFAVLSDKDYRRMIKEVTGIADRLILTSSGSDRSLELEKLKTEVVSIVNKEQKSKDFTPEIYAIDTVENSLNYALKISGTSDIICITGSITNLEHLDAGMLKKL